jgi:hypothetical protein
VVRHRSDSELFGRALDRLIQMVVFGKAHIKIGRGLGNALKDDAALAQTAPAFWGMTLQAHLDIAQIVAFKLFDTHHGTMTVKYLLTTAAELKGAFPNTTASQVEAIIKTANAQIDNLSAPLKQIRAKRNRPDDNH